MQQISYQGMSPQMHENCFVAPSATIVGDVVVGEKSSLWYNSVIRGDLREIRIGKYTNIQDNAVLHVGNREHNGETGIPTLIGDYVSVGHSAIVHACTVEDGCLIGIGAIVLDGAVIGRGSIVGAGAIVLGNTIIPPFSLVVGSPGKIVRTLPEESFAERVEHAELYWEIAAEYLKNEKV